MIRIVLTDRSFDILNVPRLTSGALNFYEKLESLRFLQFSFTMFYTGIKGLYYKNVWLIKLSWTYELNSLCESASPFKGPQQETTNYWISNVCHLIGRYALFFALNVLCSVYACSGYCLQRSIVKVLPIERTYSKESYIC